MGAVFVSYYVNVMTGGGLFCLAVTCCQCLIMSIAGGAFSSFVVKGTSRLRLSQENLEHLFTCFEIVLLGCAGS
jgi:hypothetical protein